MYNYGMMPAPMRVVRVSGKPGAEAYQMAPNSEVLLLDETQPVVWLKTTDGAGYPRLTAYDITVHEEEQFDYKSINARLKRLEDYFNAQSNAPAVEEPKPAPNVTTVQPVQTVHAGKRP